MSARSESPFEREQVDALLAAIRSAGSDLNLPLLLTVVVIGRDPGLSINDVAERMQIPQQTASRYVAILQGRYQTPGGGENAFSSKPLLSIGISEQDPRRRAVFLTADGKIRLANILHELFGTEAT